MSIVRGLFLGQFLACAALLGYGYYLQYVEFLDPCPLCMVQRLCFLAIAALALLATVYGPTGVMRRVYATLLGVFALVGAGVAGRQIWLQHLPDGDKLECGAGLEVMLETLPFFDVVAKVLKGTGDCAVVQWTFLGLSIPEWAAGCFVVMLLVNIYIFITSESNH